MVHRSTISFCHIIFQHHSDPKHNKGTLSAMDCPPQSLDLNIIEALWDHIDLTYPVFTSYALPFMFFTPHHEGRLNTFAQHCIWP